MKGASDPGWWTAVTLGLQQVGDRLETWDQTTRYMWLVVGIGATLLSVGVASGLAFASWQGTPETADAAFDTAVSVSGRLTRHLEGNETVLERIQDLEGQYRRTSAVVDSMNARLGRLYNLNVRFLCTETGRTMPECELEGLNGAPDP